MPSGWGWIGFLALACIGALASPLGAVPPIETAKRSAATAVDVERVLGAWPEKPRQAARALIAKYGPPEEVTASKLVWRNVGPWKKTMVSRDETPHNFPKPHTDFVEQVVDYRVPPDRFDDLANFDGSVTADRTRGELSARCDKEEMNVVALNLANDVVNGRRSVEDARRYLTRVAVEAGQGKPDPYTRGLQFQPMPNTQTRDPDRSTTRDLAGLPAPWGVR